MKKTYAKTIIISSLAAVISILAIVVAIPPSEDFEPGNVYWNGLSSFLTLTNATFINSTQKLQTVLDPSNVVLFIIAPDKNFSQEQLQIIRSFVERGGTLVLMDELGSINPILSNLSIGIRVDGHPLLDTLFYYSSWKLPKIINIVNSEITSNVSSIATNLPSALVIEDEENVKVLAYSSAFSFLDLNYDGNPSPEDPIGPFPVMAQVSFYKGKVIVISDSDLFINSMIGLGDNEKLLMNIVNKKNVIVDNSVWKESLNSYIRAKVLDFYAFLLKPELKYSLVIGISALLFNSLRKHEVVEEINELTEVLKRNPRWNQKVLKQIFEERRHASK